MCDRMRMLSSVNGETNCYVAFVCVNVAVPCHLCVCGYDAAAAVCSVTANADAIVIAVTVAVAVTGMLEGSSMSRQMCAICCAGLRLLPVQ